MRLLLAPLALGFKAVVCGRNALYDREWLHPTSAPLPIVSIGNIVAGGTGKTPVTLLLAAALLPEIRVAILSRGYRSQAERREEPQVVSKGEGEGPLVTPDECGDEVFLLARRLPQAIVVAGKNRAKGAEMAAALGAEVVLLDDGMQHRQLRRDIEIAVVGDKSTCGERFLPWGRLRDQPKRLLHTDLIIRNGAGPQKEGVVGVENMPIEIRCETGEKLSSIEGKRVGVFCGIASPQRFVETVRSMGAEIVTTHFLADHRKIGEKALKKLELSRPEWLLCTEKDAVKGFPQGNRRVPIAWVKSALQITQNQQTWDRLVERIKHLVKVKR